jgi:hypothetical protein
MAKDFDFYRDAWNQGLSDGRWHYPKNPGDFTGQLRDKYLAGYVKGLEGAAKEPGRYAAVKGA